MNNAPAAISDPREANPEGTCWAASSTSTEPWHEFLYPTPFGHVEARALIEGLRNPRPCGNLIELLGGGLAKSEGGEQATT